MSFWLYYFFSKSQKPAAIKCVPKLHKSGFTLIELSIVLVIIGLIVGGVLVGQDLIRAAGVRAVITQIEKYNTAANTFRGKYGSLPGDMNAASATQFGFAARGTYKGEGDGNGVIEGVTSDGAGNNNGTLENTGETTMFWVDASQVKLIDATFTIATSTGGIPSYWSAAPATFLPEAKIGNGNFVAVWSGGWGWGATPAAGDGNNYFTIAAASAGFINASGDAYWTPGLTVSQAYNIDKKVDDGLPQSGSVLAMYPYNGLVYWAAGGGGALNGNYGASTYPQNGPTTAATAYNAVNCFDNNNVTGTQKYSLAQNSNQVNCSLSFRFQ